MKEIMSNFLKILKEKFSNFTQQVSKTTIEKISIGLDLGNSTVKLVKFKFMGDIVEFVDFKIEPVQLDLKSVFEKIGINREKDFIHTSLSGPNVLLRYITFPKMSLAELKQALKFETQKYIPFSAEEINLDCAILKDDLPENKMLVLLVAVKKDFLNQRIRLFTDLGLKLSLIDLDNLALINAFNFNYNDIKEAKETICLLDIGSDITNLNILEDSLPRFSREICCAGNELNQKIKETLEVDDTTAEKLKKSPDERVFKILDEFIVKLANQIRNSFDYYETQSSGSVVKRIYLSGGSSKLLGIKEKLANLLGIEVIEWDPFRRISFPQDFDISTIRPYAQELAVAVGLALRK